MSVRLRLLMVLLLGLAQNSRANGDDPPEAQSNTSAAESETPVLTVEGQTLAQPVEAQGNTRPEAAAALAEPVSEEPSPTALPFKTGSGEPLLHQDGGPQPVDHWDRRSGKPEAEGGQVGAFARDFKLKNIAGDFVTLKEAIAQGPAVLVFWASWCVPCHGLLPDLSKLVEKISDDNVSEGGPPVWLLALNAGEDPGLVKTQIAEHFKELQAEWLLDSASSLADEYGVEALPSLFVVGRNGRILFRGVGWLDREGRQAEISALLSKVNLKK